MLRDDGTFVVAWHGPSAAPAGCEPTAEDCSRPPGTDLFARLFDSNGLPAAAMFRVNQSELHTQRAIKLAADEAGDCWAVWEQEDDNGAVGVFGRQLIGCTTRAGGEIQLNDPAGGTSVRSLSVALSASGVLTAFFTNDDLNEGDGSVIGVALNQPAVDPLLFRDGFESGDSGTWSSTVP